MNIEQQQAAFEVWAKTQQEFGTACNPVDYCRGATRASLKVWQAAQQACLSSPEIQALRDALQEVVDAADGDGWNVLDTSLEKQRAALAAMEKQR